jgi:Fic family protein
MEGGVLTEEQTRYLFETRSIKFDGTDLILKDDITTMDNHFLLFNYMLDTVDEPLTQDLIKEYHRILLNNTDESRTEGFAIGEYKNFENTIGFFIETAKPENVEKEMTDLLDEYNSKAVHFNDIVDFHYKFESIHPFQNGNGRVGRMIMFKECLKNNIVPFVIENDIKRYYTLGLSEYPKSPHRLREVCGSSQDAYTSLCMRFGIDIADMERDIPNKNKH